MASREAGGDMEKREFTTQISMDEKKMMSDLNRSDPGHGPPNGPAPLVQRRNPPDGVVGDGAFQIIEAAGGRFEGEVLGPAPAAGVDPKAPVSGHRIFRGIFDGELAVAPGIFDDGRGGDGI